MLFRLFASFLASTSLLLLGCRPSEEEAKPALKVAAASSAPLSSAPAPGALPKAASPKTPTTLLELPSSAYSALLHVDDNALYVVTPKEIARVTANESIERLPVSLDPTMSARHDEVVFFSSGALRRQVWGTKESSLLSKIASPPERLSTSDRGIFLLRRTSDGKSRIEGANGARLRLLYESDSPIATLTAKDDDAYFVEAAEGGFRLARVTSTGEKSFGEIHPGRTPSALTLTDSVYYYDGPRSEVRRASLSLATEEVVAKDVVCSPLHVDAQLYCASPGGITALGLDGNARADLPVNARGPITTLVTFANRLVWIEDAGADRLIVRTLPRT